MLEALEVPHQTLPGRRGHGYGDGDADANRMLDLAQQAEEGGRTIFILP